MKRSRQTEYDEIEMCLNHFRDLYLSTESGVRHVHVLEALLGGTPFQYPLRWRFDGLGNGLLRQLSAAGDLCL